MEINEIPLRSLAHLGDSVYEVFIREKTIYQTPKIDILHKLTIKYVNAEFQAELLEKLNDILTDKEKDIVRRGRNLATTTSRRCNHKLHRLSTAFEALVGYLYLTDKNRLDEVFEVIEQYIN